MASFSESSSSLTAVTLTWNHGAGSRDSYTVRWDNGGEKTGIAAADTSTEIIGLTPEASYTFRIVAVSGSSAESGEMTTSVTLPGNCLPPVIICPVLDPYQASLFAKILSFLA